MSTILKLLSWILSLLVCIGRWIKKRLDSVGKVLHPTRVIFALVAIYALALTMTDQGRELVLSLPLGGEPVLDWVKKWGLLVIAMAWTAVQAWWWARALQGFDNAKRPSKRAETWIPRFYAFTVFAAPAFASILPPQGETSWWQYLTHESHWGAALVMLAMGLLMLLFLAQRTNLKILATIVNPKKKLGDAVGAGRGASGDPAAPGTPVKKLPSIFDRFTKSGLAILTLSILGAILMLALERIWPAQTGSLLGSLPLALMGLSSMMSVLAILTISEAMNKAPVLTALVAIALGLSLIPGLDHHGVRSLDETAPSQPFTDVKTAFGEWEQVMKLRGTPAAPMVLVYTAGGGIRAAYWTAALLAELDNRQPGFHDQIFAISGVSGGSVGAVFWTAALPNQTADALCSVPPDASHRQITDALRADHLATTIGALLFNDLLYAFIPIGKDDRAAALEDSWSSAFNEQTGRDCLNQGFNALWSHVGENQWRPILLLNGTHQESGRRIITSPLKIANDDFPNSFDFFYLFGRDVRASTAALNSARFTYLSPAGRIQTADGVDKGHILDGGYFENYGARTMRDLMVALDKMQSDTGTHHPIIVVEIVNDTDLGEEDASRGLHDNAQHMLGDAKSPGWYGYGILNEVIAPFEGLLGTRGARGILEAKLSASNLETYAVSTSQLSNVAARSATHFEHFQLRLCPVNPKPPLGWVLGKQSADVMDNLISGKLKASCADVSEQIGKILASAKAVQ